MRSALLLLALASPVAAQSLTDVNRAVDFAFGNGGGATTLSVGLTKIGVVGKFAKLRAGLGLRGTLEAGTLNLTPQDAQFVPNSVVDTLRISVAPIALNVAVHLGYLLTDRVQAGFNIDLFGYSTGGSRSGIYTENATAPAEGVNARAASINIFQGGSQDRGNLNSQFFLMWAFSDRHAIKAGLSHQRVEYKTDTKLASNTNRFSTFSNLVFIGAQIAR
jgi:hypothetical protein